MRLPVIITVGNSIFSLYPFVMKSTMFWVLLFCFSASASLFGQAKAKGFSYSLIHNTKVYRVSSNDMQIYLPRATTPLKLNDTYRGPQTLEIRRAGDWIVVGDLNNNSNGQLIYGEACSNGSICFKSKPVPAGRYRELSEVTYESMFQDNMIKQQTIKDRQLQKIEKPVLLDPGVQQKVQKGRQ
jgi:hypothetical protein